MKHIFTLALFFSLTLCFSQDFKEEWKEVIKFELDGKVKSAHEAVDAIYKKAKKKKAADQIIKCFIYQSKFIQVRDENYQTIVINNLKKEIKDSKNCQKALLSFIYVSILERYYQDYSHIINRRTPLKKPTPADFQTWTGTDFQNEIAKLYNDLLDDEKELRAANIKEFSSILEISPYTDTKKLSVYDFLYNESLDYYFKKMHAFYQPEYKKLQPELLKKTSDFIKLKTDTIADATLQKVMELYQHNEKYCVKNGNDDITLLHYSRMKRFSSYADNKENFISELSQLEQSTTNAYLLQEIRIDKAKFYFDATSKQSDINYYPKVLEIVDKVLSTHENPNAKAEAETLKEKILRKRITINLPNHLYPNQNYRAFIEFKNIDTVKVSYFKIPLSVLKRLDRRVYYYQGDNYEKINRDSLVLDYIKKHKPLKVTEKILPSVTDHFDYSTEVLMDQLDSGMFLLFFETNNPYGIDSKKAYAYQTIQVSSLDYTEEKNQEFDSFQVLDKKTGQPIEKVMVRNIDTGESEVTNKTGVINFPKRDYNERYSYDELLLTKDRDTLYSTYYRSSKYTKNDEKEDYEAKAMVFFDRAIYRPGQKVHFKGFVLKNKQDVKSVVPDLTLHLKINDADDNEVKAFDVKTNEFGSFTGAYDIPKNVLTGEFTLTLEEPNDSEVDTKYYDKKEKEHAFWDFADFNESREFRFKVEEYKRPTFEVNFDKIKKNYTIGDKVTISGNAKTLAGSNLTNAKVAYTISKRTLEKDGFDDDRDNYINTETATDENGNFKIEFEASEEGTDAADVKLMHFKINVVVTDVNGETRTAESNMVVGDEMLKLRSRINSILYLEDKNNLQIEATTLNNFPINTKGTITFIAFSQKEFLLSREHFPELNTMTREQFEALFPYEAYDKKDLEAKESKVLSMPFDTEKSTSPDLSFLKNFKTGRYEIVLEAKDAKSNTITNNNTFELRSKNKSISSGKLFTYQQLTNDKENFVFKIQSVVPDLFVTAKMFVATEKKKEMVIQLKNGVGLVKIPKADSYTADLQFHFSTLWENNYFSDQITVAKDEIETKLEFEVLSMRNKIEPGSNESWSFIIKNSKLQSEVLASMYDMSLDQFATAEWTAERFYKRTSFASVSRRIDIWYDKTVRFENLYFESKYYKTYIPKPKLNWFGFGFNYRNTYLNTEYLKKVKPIAEIPKNSKTIYGIVTDQSGPLPGVNVVVKGTNRSVQTDFDGNYEIEVKPGEVLVFSYIGFNNVTRVVEREKNINIFLKDASVELESVVVKAYAATTKKSTVVAQASVIEYDSSPNSSFIQTLQGQVVGLDVSIDLGKTGDKSSIIIRGIGTLSANQNPLYIIDGVPVDSSELIINTDDIESATVLKDTSATAIYGSRGANGVIIINTKKGAKELQQVKTRTNFNETGFFYPNLITDEAGHFQFSFTNPESLTKWKLRLFAHNKKAEMGYFQSEIISHKDIMVMPNMPRFVREKDVINFAVKVVNLTLQEKSGNAVLLLYDAANDVPIDEIALNKDNIKPFNCKGKQSVVINWKVTIPEGTQGLRYKVIAKSGTMSDGEENILPVLTNRILVTESIPIWVKGNTKREFTIDNLKNNTSTTLQNHSFTLEYTSNPTWFALQSLPYLMTYEHDCAEQTFAKFYANYVAEKIITSNPKIEALFKKWQTNEIGPSKLRMNEELKSIVLAETPWLMDTETDEQKNQRLALLMDLNTLKENNEKAIKKVEDRILPTGGFAWFNGGNENRYISQHILSGIGHLTKLFPADTLKFKKIASAGIPNLDRNFVSYYSKTTKIGRPTLYNLNYMYTRSFFLKDYPLSKKHDSIIKLQLERCKEDWLSYSLREKGYLALTMNRFGEKEFAKKIITSLKETISNNDEIGMYWINNTSSYEWYGSAVETQALLIEAFAEIDNNREMIDAMKVWLIKNKQANDWGTTKQTTEAIYALLFQGNDWTSLKENTKIKMGDEKILTHKLLTKDDEAETGYCKLQFNATEINTKMGTITIQNKTRVPGFGGAYWQYFETLENIEKDSTKTMSIDKKLFKKIKTTSGDQLFPLENETLRVGDLLTVRLIIISKNDLDFVHLKDLRASCLEPVDVISGYEWKSGTGFYKSTKDTATHFFFDNLSKGTYVLEYDLRVTNTGTFDNGISTIQSMYAPEYSAHSQNIKINIP
ncbi:MG2 domain-containing protein [Flavobacterium sp.]|uniref:alpha-2-macroglobulin family protein n=1 Tax=Flavobacterium sp. TaxID=239 RepID=UPI002FDE68ED